ncbi:hypothetical protein EDD29_5280 [Actinocorallia herbida]|uniref:Uncharacterized protein n=1 Tax=Actinocorallia herbida TaxID=58109 RepID=A0A3N1D2E4_9ACTN|nr:hypothetical protein [Actinocorallia herbida]ROO87656.1 hypothetical protein EDD29_5280 [Actinocorallia herbida]
MGGLFDTTAGLMDRRSMVATFVPLVLYLVTVGAVVVSGVGLGAAVSWWSGLGTDAKVFLPVLVLVGVLLAAQIMAAVLPSLMRLFEGYWESLPLGAVLARRGRRRHDSRYERLVRGDPRRLLYPVQKDRFLPTRLGNILRSAEEHSDERYGIASVVAWPRLYPTLPEPFQQSLAAASADLELLIVIAALGVSFAATGGALAMVLLPWYGVLACVWGGLATAWLGYLAAVRAAEPYGALYRAAFDVHRWGLLDVMGLSRPSGYQQEAEQWRQLSKLWAQGSVDTEGAHHLGYPERDTAAEAEAEAEAGAEAPPPPPESTLAEGPEPHVPDLPQRRPSPPGTGRTRSAAPGRIAAAVVLGILLAVAGQAVRDRPKPVLAGQALPAYRILTASDLRGSGREAFVDRYPLRPVPEGAKVTSGLLGPPIKKSMIAGKGVVTLKPKQFLPGTAAPGAVGSLRVMGRPMLLIKDVLILDLPGGGEGGRLVAAVPLAELDRLLERSSTSEVYFVTE